MSNAEFSLLLTENAEFLRPFAINLTKDHESAKDLYQDTLYRAISNKDKYNVGTNIKAWLYTIMRNIFINDYRRRVKHSTVLDKTDNLYLINSSQEFVSNEAEDTFVMQDLQAAIRTLSTEYRIPFIKHYQGYKYQEIAEELRLPLGTVKSRIFFARKQLKDYLEGIGFER